MKKEIDIVHEIKKLQLGIVENISNQMRNQSITELSKKAYDGKGDVSYVIDKNLDGSIDSFFSVFSNHVGSTVLVSEGTGIKAYGAEKPEDCKYIVIVDPIDGTRGLMYNMRPAWTLAGIAQNKDNVSLKDIEIVVQTEIPTTKQYLFDSFVGIKNKGTTARRYDITIERNWEWKPQPSKADNLAHGFASLSKFFEGSKVVTAQIEEELFRRLGLTQEGKALTFDDQYISTGGQYAMLMNGSYRFCGDLRPLFSKGLCAHPYDICTKLAATELGVEIAGLDGKELDAPLDTETNVGWLGYANKKIRNQVEPTLMEILNEVR